MTTICIHLDDSSFYAGHVLKGVVVLDIQGDVSCRALNVSLIGQEYCQIEYTDKTERSNKSKGSKGDSCNQRHLANETQEIVRLQATRVEDENEIFACKGGHGKVVLPEGVHQIPFGIELPESLPGSTHICNDENPKDHCSIKYHVKAVLEGSGRLWNYQTTEETKIRAKPLKESRRKVPYGDAAELLTENALWHPFAWFLTDGGGYFRRLVTVDNTRLKASDICSIQIKFKNGTSYDIRSIEATMYQTLEWKTNHPRKKHKEKQSIGWTGFELPSIDRDNIDGDDDEQGEELDKSKPGSHSQKDNPAHNSNETSAPNTSNPPRAYMVNAPLTVHRDCHPSYDGKLLSVRHELLVRIRLRSFWASVTNVAVPITIGPS